MQWITRTVAAVALACVPALANAQAQGGTPAYVEALKAAQASLIEMTKLPAAATLTGDVRTSVAGFVSEFNAFAALEKGWQPKYQTASASLDKMLAAAAAAPAPAASAAPAAGAPAAAPDPNAPGVWEPTVVEKLKEVRKHLDTFETSVPSPLFDAIGIEKILKAAGADSGTATLDAAKLAEVRELLKKIRVAAGGV